MKNSMLIALLLALCSISPASAEVGRKNQENAHLACPEIAGICDDPGPASIWFAPPEPCARCGCIGPRPPCRWVKPGGCGCIRPCLREPGFDLQLRSDRR